MPARSLAIVTTQAARPLDEDLAPLQAALQELGIGCAVLDWDDAGADWGSFGIALLRSPWDYTQRLPDFLAWAERTAQATHLLNPLDVVRWNTDKHYLLDLQRAGVAIVPSAFVEPGENGAAALAEFLRAHAGAAEFVIKPAIGAGSRDAQRHARDDADAARAHAQRLLDARRSVLLQPYLARVDQHGETALVFFEGKFSHAIRKGPLLRRGEGPTRALFAAEHITPREPDAAELELAVHALSAIPSGAPLAYARIDLIRAADGTPRLLELELTEPSLFFDHAPGSALRFAAHLRDRLGRLEP